MLSLLVRSEVITLSAYNVKRNDLKPIDGATGNETGKSKRTIPEFFSDRREAQDDVEVVLDAVDEELHHVLRRRRRLGRLPLDDRQQLGDDFTLN
jgi:hypothetical protein